MRIGLVLGKFYPLHEGHLALIEFAVANSDKLYVLICASDRETIPGETRLNWLRESCKTHQKIEPVLLKYNEADLPNSSVSSREVSSLWASKIESLFDKIDVIFSSESYGDFLAEFLGSEHRIFDEHRKKYSVSATEIRGNPIKHWNSIAAAAKPYFVRKVCILGTESTGKSTLTERLAARFNTSFVPEMAREIVEKTVECTPMHLNQIAELQAKTIIDKTHTANRVLLVDTNLNITRSYSRFLFNTDLKTDAWVEEANKFDLYLYLDKDAPYFQDGTRLQESDRDRLNEFHLNELEKSDVPYILISGNWDERFSKAVDEIERILS